MPTTRHSYTNIHLYLVTLTLKVRIQLVDIVTPNYYINLKCPDQGSSLDAGLNFLLESEIVIS